LAQRIEGVLVPQDPIGHDQLADRFLEDVTLLPHKFAVALPFGRSAAEASYKNHVGP
jgi:hypothetical protein